MQKSSSFLWTAMGVLVCLLVVSPVARSQDEVTGDFGSLPRGSGGGISLDHLTDLSAAALAQEGEEMPAWARGWSLSGFLQAAYTWNFNAPNPDRGGGPTFAGGSAENLGRVFDTEHNDFTVHHVQLHVQKEATDASWIGLGIKTMIGHDAKFIHAPGLDTADDLDLTDAYFTVRIPSDVAILGGGEFKVGKWETIVGAEVISAPDNINYSRSFLFGFAIPFVHVGVLYSQDVMIDDDGKAVVGIDAGIANSVLGRAEDDNDSKAILARVRVAPCDFMKFHVATIFGNEPVGSSPGLSTDGDLRAILDIVAELSMPEGVPEFLRPLTFVLNYDYGGQEGGGNLEDATAGSPSRGTAKWYGFSGIAKYQVNERWYVAFRGETYHDPEGITLGLLTEGDELGKHYMELTTTVGYSPWSNLLLRAEWRYDKADRDVFAEGETGEDFDDVQNTLSVDAVVTF